MFLQTVKYLENRTLVVWQLIDDVNLSRLRIPRDFANIEINAYNEIAYQVTKIRLCILLTKYFE